MEYYSALKRKDILVHATTRMNPDIMLSEISQSQKDNIDKNKMVVAQKQKYASVGQDRKPRGKPTPTVT